MEIKLTLQDPSLRDLLGWNQSEDTISFEGQTMADFFKQIQTTDGKTLYDNLVDGVGSKSKIWYNCMAFIQKDGFDRPLKSGDKIILMRSIPGGG